LRPPSRRRPGGWRAAWVGGASTPEGRSGTRGRATRPGSTCRERTARRISRGLHGRRAGCRSRARGSAGEGRGAGCHAVSVVITLPFVVGNSFDGNYRVRMGPARRPDLGPGPIALGRENRLTTRGPGRGRGGGESLRASDRLGPGSSFASRRKAVHAVVRRARAPHPSWWSRTRAIPGTHRLLTMTSPKGFGQRIGRLRRARHCRSMSPCPCEGRFSRASM